MQSVTAKPRSIVSIVFIGVFLGPALLMCWLSKGRWALFYLGLTLLWIIVGTALELYGLLPPVFATPLFQFTTVGDAAVNTLLWGAGIVHALAIRQGALQRKWFRWFATVPALVTLALLVFLLPLRVFLFQPFSMPSGSMAPNLVIGDYFFLSKTAYGYSRFSFPFGLATFEGRIFAHPPARGDIAVFKLPRDRMTDYVKRIVGLPGDRIQMRGGVLHINGTAVGFEPVTLPAEFSADEPGQFFRETLPEGRSYVIKDILPDGAGDNTGEYLVPPGHYFVMGDNRDNSNDSRFPSGPGYVPEANFIGRMAFRFWNSEGFPLDNRPEEK